MSTRIRNSLAVLLFSVPKARLASLIVELPGSKYNLSGTPRDEGVLRRLRVDMAYTKDYLYRIQSVAPPECAVCEAP